MLVLIKDYKRLSMHDAPFVGETKNTYGDRKGYDEREERQKKKLVTSGLKESQ